MLGINSRKVWLLIDTGSWYGVMPSNEYKMEMSDYFQGLMDCYDVQVFYHPGLLQKRIDELQRNGYEVRELEEVKG